MTCLALPLLAGAAGVAGATETENLGFRLMPAPGKVVVDGQIGDWDLSGSLFVCSDVESYRDEFASWQSAMYDADNLYLLARWNDPTPMNNPGMAGSDMGFQGDCLQARMIVSSTGTPTVVGGDATQRTTHITAWRGRDGRDLIDLTFGKKLDEGNIPDAKKQGAQQAFVKNADGKGYVQEIAIPWKLLTVDGQAPKAGQQVIMTYEPNFGTKSKYRITTKDLFRPAVTPDRVFAFMAYPCWGVATVEGKNGIAPLPVRLADKRTFPVSLQGGLPVVDWSGLYKEDQLEGFAKIALQMPEDGFVSLILKRADGQVVRHLLNAKFLAKGAHEVLWDGLTTTNGSKPGDPVAEGTYTWEAIWHRGIGLSLVGWANNAGKAPFDSPGGNWGGDQGDPTAVEADKERVYLGWAGAEAGQAVVCTDLDGKVKWRHKRGGFGGAQLLAVDQGTVFVYDAGQGNTLYRLDAVKGDYTNWKGTDVATLELGAVLSGKQGMSEEEKKKGPFASGLAAIGGRLVVSHGSLSAPWRGKQASGDKLYVLDGETGKTLNTIAVSDPGDLKVGADGKLYLVCGDGRIATVDPLAGTVTTVVEGLHNVASVTADQDGNVYVGMGDPDNQVKVFDRTGKPLRTIGKAGGRPLLGPWDKEGMRFISGLKVDTQGKLWVMERDGSPRRISLWNATTGAFVKELFGPTDYGASGGAICPTDAYTMAGQGCEWKLSPETGRAECIAAIARMRWQNARFGTGKDGRTYLAVGGGWPEHSPVNIFERLGQGNWKLRTSISTTEDADGGNPQHVTVWSDRNDDQQRQPDEVHTYDLPLGGWIDGWYLYFNQAMTFSGGSYRIDVTGWTACGAPEYDLGKALKLPAPDDVTSRGGMGAQRGMVTEDGTHVLYNGRYAAERSDFLCYDVRSGKLLFAYPNNYVGVHGGHLAPPAKLGMIRAAYDIVGTMAMPAPLGDLFVIGTDKGEWHLLSSTGFYVGHLFEGDAMKIRWPDEAIPGVNMNVAPPGMGAEDFGGSAIRLTDGTVHVQAGKTAFINCAVTGLETVKALANGAVTISAADRVQALQFQLKLLGTPEDRTLVVKKKTVAFTGDAQADFNTPSIHFGQDGARIHGWLAHDDATLYVGWQVEDKTPWVNGGTGFDNLYACGDTVDLQLGTDPAADPKRGEPGAGDLRLSIGKLQGRNVAVLYRRVSAEKAPKTFFSGTSRNGYTMEFVKILDGVTIQEKTGDGQYVVEAAIPLAALGASLKPDLKLGGDLGATFSDPAGTDTSLRVYWSNQATGLVADEVEELKMQPAQWGVFTFE